MGALVARGQITIVDLHDGVSYTLNINGGVRGIAYAADGSNPDPTTNTATDYTAEVLRNGVKIEPHSYSWTTGGCLSGGSTRATFRPIINTSYVSGNTFVTVKIKETRTSDEMSYTIPVVCTKHADGLDWIGEWNGTVVDIKGNRVVTPKLFAGKNTGTSMNPNLTGVAVGLNVLDGNDKTTGIVGYKNNDPRFKLDTEGNFFVGSGWGAIGSGSGGGLKYDADKKQLNISGNVKMTTGSTIGNKSAEELLQDVAGKASINDMNTRFELTDDKINAGVTESKAYTDIKDGVTKEEVRVLGADLEIAKNQISLKVEQTDIDKTVSNVVIGGRNLILNSTGNLGDTSNWSTEVFIDNATQKNGLNSLAINIANNTSGDRYQGSQILKNKLTAGEKVVFSGWYYISSNIILNQDLQIYIRLYKTDNNTYRDILSTIIPKTSIVSRWVKFEVAQEVPSGYDGDHRVQIAIGVNGKLFLSGLKLEKGTKATDWTPAPEDTDKAIADTITKTEEKISQAKAEIKLTTDSIKQSVSSVDIKVNTVTVTANNALSNANKGISDSLTAAELAKALSTGKMLNTDPTFRNGVNGTTLYNNGNNGNVYLTRIAKPSDCPTTSTHCMEVKSVGVGNPNFGGFHFATATRANAIFITKIVAKIPTGRSINFGTNDTGTGGSQKWLTPVIGTGRYEEYICRLISGSTGTFSSTNFFSVSGGSTPTASSPLIWQIAYATVFDLTDNDETLNTHTTQISNTNTKVSTIEANLSSITQRVSSTENTTQTIDDKVVSIDNRVRTAENKITDSAIVNTVKASQSNGQNTFAQTSTVEQLVNQVKFDFSSSGGYNILKNSSFNYHGDLTRYWAIHKYGNTGDGNAGLIPSSYDWGFPDNEVRTIQIKATNINGEVGFIQEFNTEIGKEYTLTVRCAGHRITQGYIGVRNATSYNFVATKYFNPMEYSGGKNSDNWGTLSLTFKADSRNMRVDLLGTHFQNDGYLWFAKPMISAGREGSAWTTNKDEIYSGNTIIDAGGVTINNGALRIKNNAGQEVISADSNGNLIIGNNVTIRGRLQPDDYNLHLFSEANKCIIGGGYGALRLQYDRLNYVSIDDSYTRFWNKYNDNGTRYMSIGLDWERHGNVIGGNTLLKLLGAGVASVQSRWSSDSGYAQMKASEFSVGSLREYKTNIHEPIEIDFTKILMENDIMAYNLITEVDYVNKSIPSVVLKDGSNVAKAGLKAGLILDDLTEEAKMILNPENGDTIALYPMISTLWKVCQEQQKRIEKLEQLVALINKKNI